MEASPVLNGILMGWFFALWLCARLIDVIAPTTSISARGLRDSIDSTGSYCSDLLTIDEQRVEGDCGTVFLIREKVDILLANSRDTTAVMQWFLQQVRMDHLIADVLSCEHFWLTVFGVSVAGFMVQLFVFDPFITLTNARTKHVMEMKRAETTYVHEMMKKFIVEKLLVLAYVVIRNEDKSHITRQSPIYKWTYHETEATVFAVWFTLIWSVSSLTLLADQRLEMIIRFVTAGKPLCGNRTNEDFRKDFEQEVLKEKHDEDKNNALLLMKRLIIMLTACFLTATAMTSFGLTSFKVVHTLYGLMFTVEGLEVLVHSVYVTYRVACWQLISNAALHDTEAFRRRAYAAKRIADFLFSSLSIMQYLLYLVVGTIINGKLIPLVFVAQLTHHLQHSAGILFDYFRGRDTSTVVN